MEPTSDRKERVHVAAERAYFRNEQVGFVFQSFNLIATYVYETSSCPAYRKMPAREVRRLCVVAPRGGMTHRRNPADQLSGGQQQRVASAACRRGQSVALPPTSRLAISTPRTAGRGRSATNSMCKGRRFAW